MELKDFILAIKYGAKSGDLGINNVGELYLGQGLPFTASVSVGTVAQVSGVTLLADSVVTNSRSVYILGIIAKTGADAWNSNTLTSLAIEDNSGTSFISWGTGVMTASAVVFPTTANLTLSNPFILGTGGTAGRGLRVKGDGTATAGQTITVTAYGLIK